MHKKLEQLRLQNENGDNANNYVLWPQHALHLEERQSPQQVVTLIEGAPVELQLLLGSSPHLENICVSIPITDRAGRLEEPLQGYPFHLEPPSLDPKVQEG